jgi:hypothetical protein
MRTTEIKCDQCGADVTYTSNFVDYRIVLGSEGKSHLREGKSGGVLTDVNIPDPFPKAHHFCNEECLAVWVINEYPDASAAYGRQQKHRTWLAEKEAKARKEKAK